MMRRRVMTWTVRRRTGIDERTDQVMNLTCCTRQVTIDTKRAASSTSGKQWHAWAMLPLWCLFEWHSGHLYAQLSARYIYMPPAAKMRLLVGVPVHSFVPPNTPQHHVFSSTLSGNIISSPSPSPARPDPPTSASACSSARPDSASGWCAAGSAPGARRSPCRRPAGPRS